MGARADPYATLGVGRNCSGAEVRRAYRKQAVRWHPDKHTKGTAHARAEVRTLKPFPWPWSADDPPDGPLCAGCVHGNDASLTERSHRSQRTRAARFSR